MILLDTHIWLDWIMKGSTALPSGIAMKIESDTRVAVSAISCFEVTHLVARGAVRLETPVDEWLQVALAPSGIECLPITCEIARRSVALPMIHKDPADRIIIATAIAHEAELASRDSKFPLYAEVAARLITS